VSEERTGGAGPRRESGPRSEDAVKSLRQVFERLWPVDRKPVFNGLVRAIDEFDREQKRRRKGRDVGER
jgi:hypothetical protein